MEKEQTAFKHPNCGGVIMQYSSDDGNIVFECDACGEQADEIDSLILRGLVIIRRGSSSINDKDTERQDRRPGD